LTNEVGGAIVDRLFAAVQPLKAILVGSHARGEADDHSDTDVLIIEPTASNRYEEMMPGSPRRPCR
jgi:predicted nucleotidyltransferase